MKMAGGITMVVIGVLVTGFCALALIGDWIYGLKVQNVTLFFGAGGISLVVNGIRFILKAAEENKGMAARPSRPEGWYEDRETQRL